MSGHEGFTITRGFREDERPRMASLFWEAFRGKLSRVMAPEEKALGFIEAVLKPDFALVARDPGGTLLGAAGFKTAEGGLVEGGLRDMMCAFGRWGGLWRGMLLSVLEREVETGIFQMDGIFVTEEARGRGVGGALLEAIADEAVRCGSKAIRLDVIDSNPRARALYERRGFEAVGEEHTGPFRWVFGFAKATRMERAL